jgi:hypothetical protein
MLQNWYLGLDIHLLGDACLGQVVTALLHG